MYYLVAKNVEGEGRGGGCLPQKTKLKIEKKTFFVRESRGERGKHF